MTNSIVRNWLSFCGLALASAAAPAQELLWIRQFGTPSDDAAHALAPDAAGGVYVAGHMSFDAMLARYDSAGNRLWIREFATAGRDTAFALAPDDAGGVYVAGETTGSLGGPNAGSEDAWLLRCDSNGNRLWILQFGTDRKDIAWALAPDGAGGAFVAGETGGSLGGPGAGGPFVWLARYDSAGNRHWILQFGTSHHDVARALTPDGAGGAFVAGYTFGSLGGPHGGSSDVWIARYDSAGNRLWIRQFGAGDHEYAFGLAPDGSGGAFVAGARKLHSPVFALIGRYDSAGNRLWLRETSQGQVLAYAVAPDGSGGAFIAGGREGSFSVVLRARYDGDGHRLWLDLPGSTPTSQWAYAVAYDGSGGAFVAGAAIGSFGGPFAGWEDVWLARWTGGASCYVDCNADGVLDAADLACFQSRFFLLHDPYADCNGDTRRDLADFGCFQTKFALGCP